MRPAVNGVSGVVCHYGWQQTADVIILLTPAEPCRPERGQVLNQAAFGPPLYA
jgi:hypothetical protein